ncbi:unnamed protein product [Dracunculus medinensis]|uniref:Uncharacterized protein n=1 Tax=Dracunculus medinensis TaxID=318479 RepID=A0A0N4UAP8_DRAME|nr:unnamed protein product [Dracunculus medinensis]
MYYDAMVAQKSPSNNLLLSNYLIFTVLGTVGLLTLIILTVCISKRRRFSYQGVLIQSQKTAVALKYGNVKGPCGLKNSPSLLSPISSSDSSNSSPITSLPPSTASSQTFNKISPSELGQQRGYICFSLQYCPDSSALQVKFYNNNNIYYSLLVNAAYQAI